MDGVAWNRGTINGRSRSRLLWLEPRRQQQYQWNNLRRWLEYPCWLLTVLSGLDRSRWSGSDCRRRPPEFDPPSSEVSSVSHYTADFEQPSVLSSNWVPTTSGSRPTGHLRLGNSL